MYKACKTDALGNQLRNFGVLIQAIKSSQIESRRKDIIFSPLTFQCVNFILQVVWIVVCCGKWCWDMIQDKQTTTHLYAHRLDLSYPPLTRTITESYPDPTEMESPESSLSSKRLLDRIKLTALSYCLSWGVMGKEEPASFQCDILLFVWKLQKLDKTGSVLIGFWWAKGLMRSL